MDDKLVSMFKGTDDFPMPTNLMLRIVDLGQDPNTSPVDLENLVKNDPSLVVRLLHVANSPLYGVRQCDNLREALLLIGLDGALALALTFCVTQMQHQMQAAILKDTIDLKNYWRRSMLGGLASRVLGQSLRRDDCEQLFLAGLLQDIGMLLIAKAMPEIYQGVNWDLEQGLHGHILEVERQKIEVDHAEIGAWLVDDWGLPKRLSEAVYYSHGLMRNNEEFPNSFDLCVAFSGIIADIYLLPEFPDSFHKSAEQLEALLGVDEALLVDVFGLVCAQIEELEAIFEMSVLDEQVREQKLTQAKSALLKRIL
jgi:HD-like signal output (HDOD) protein